MTKGGSWALFSHPQTLTSVSFHVSRQLSGGTERTSGRRLPAGAGWLPPLAQSGPNRAPFRRSGCRCEAGRGGFFFTGPRGTGERGVRPRCCVSPTRATGATGGSPPRTAPAQAGEQRGPGPARRQVGLGPALPALPGPRRRRSASLRSRRALLPSLLPYLQKTPTKTK